MVARKPRKMATADAKKSPKKHLLKLEFETAEAKARLSKAAVLDRTRGGLNPWAHRTLAVAAEYRIAGLSMDTAYSAALREMRKNDPPEAARITAAVEKAALDAAKSSRK